MFNTLSLYTSPSIKCDSIFLWSCISNKLLIGLRESTETHMKGVSAGHQVPEPRTSIHSIDHGWSMLNTTPFLVSWFCKYFSISAFSILNDLTFTALYGREFQRLTNVRKEMSTHATVLNDHSLFFQLRPLCSWLSHKWKHFNICQAPLRTCLFELGQTSFLCNWRNTD